jgi:hypothetical protein
MSQIVSSMEGRKEHLFRSGEDLSIDTERPYKRYAFLRILFLFAVTYQLR